MTALTSTKFTLKFDRETVLRVIYAANFRVLRLDKDIYDELGRPEIITVTIEPGDQLNG